MSLVKPLPALCLCLSIGCSLIDGQGEETGAGLTQEEIDLMKPCTIAAPGDRLDITGGCADTVCATDSYAQINQKLGETGHCSGASTPGATGQTLRCSWREGAISAWFDDDEGDDVPDEGPTMQGLHLSASWDGSDPNGLAMGLSLRCFIDLLGMPDQVNHTLYDNVTRQVSGLYWDALGFEVEDDHGRSDDLPNGYVDGMEIGYRRPPPESHP